MKVEAINPLIASPLRRSRRDESLFPRASALRRLAGTEQKDAIDRNRWRIQPVSATVWLNISAGVWKPRVFLDLSFNCRANALSLACE